MGSSSHLSEILVCYGKYLCDSHKLFSEVLVSLLSSSPTKKKKEGVEIENIGLSLQLSREHNKLNF